MEIQWKPTYEKRQSAVIYPATGKPNQQQIELSRMSTIKIIVAVCATVLLAASLSAPFVHAEVRLASIKGLFLGPKSYAILADHLYTSTQSAELADNTKAAGSLLSVRSDSKENVKQLVQAFGSLTGDSSNPESFCNKDNLASLRRVAEGLRDGGNLGPEEITAAISRLNSIVVKVIGDARKVCDPHLTGKWPKPWRPEFSDPAMERRIIDLHFVAESFLYEGFVGPPLSPSFEPDWQASTVSRFIKETQRRAKKAVGTDKRDSLSTEKKSVIIKQLDEFIYKPCSEFVLFNEVKEVLVPFNDMLKSWYVVSTGLLDKYYKNKGVGEPKVNTDGYDLQVSDRAYSYQACQRFFATSKAKVARMVRKWRKIEDYTY